MAESQTPIPGTVIDPPAKPQVDKVRAVERRTRLGAVIYLAILRFGGSHSTLLAGGSTYYLFLGILSAIFLGFGLVARFSTERLQNLLNTGLEKFQEIFPDFLGSQGIDPDALQAWGQGASLISLLVLLYSGTGTINAMSGGLHIVYGAPMDPRNFFLKKLRQVGWLLLLLPLAVLAFIPTAVVASFGKDIREWLGVQEASWTAPVVTVTGIVVAVSINYLIFRLVLSRLGGIRPDLTSLRRGALVGAVLFEIMRFAMVGIAQWALARPQYGAFALPVAILFVIYLQWLVFFFVASLTAAMASIRAMLALDTEAAETQDEAEEVAASESEPAVASSVTTTEVLTATEGADAGHHPTIALSGAGSESDENGHQRTEVLQPDATAHTDAQHTQVIAHDRSADDRSEPVDDSPNR
jgi:uncharacterized BrkB/YihY/UPF0761 family membrane protein